MINAKLVPFSAQEFRAQASGAASAPRVLPARTQPGSPERAIRRAFTLVELLVVIAIIIVLIGLIIVAVPRALDPAFEAQARTDITQLSAAIQAFETKFGVPYIPSRLILCKFYGNYFNPATGQAWTGLHQDSLNYLKRLFPRIDTRAWSAAGIDWSGDGNMVDPPMGPQGIAVSGVPTPFVGFALEGEQCLPFFLGGIPQANPDGTFTATGFSKNASNPAQSGGDRLPPFFEFRSNRLIQWTPPGQPAGYTGTAPGFPSYLDSFGHTPYAYFSSNRMSETQSNGYNRYVNYSNPYLRLWPAGTNNGIQCGPVTTDCQALPFAKGKPADENNLGVFPYVDSAGAGGTLNYLNPRTYQLISAGKDLYFGQGTAICTYPGGPPGSTTWFGGPYWTPGNASNLLPIGVLGGGDDITNFYDHLLGVSAQ